MITIITKLNKLTLLVKILLEFYSCEMNSSIIFELNSGRITLIIIYSNTIIKLFRK